MAGWPTSRARAKASISSGAEEGVRPPLEADRRDGLLADPGGAQRAGAVRRPDLDIVAEGQEHVVQRVVHGVGVRHGVPGPQQVGPADRADQERAAAEHGGRLGRAIEVGDRVGHVLGGVARGVERREPQPARVDGGVIREPSMVVAEGRALPDRMRGAGEGGEIPCARDVVVVEVRLDDRGDPQAGGRGRLEVHVHIASRVDDDRRGGRLVHDHRGQVAEPAERVGLDAHPAERSIEDAGGPTGPAAGLAAPGGGPCGAPPRLLTARSNRDYTPSASASIGPRPSQPVLEVRSFPWTTVPVRRRPMAPRTTGSRSVPPSDG